jgi:hypothetical protein
MAEPLTAGRLRDLREIALSDAHWAPTPQLREAALEQVEVIDLALIGLAQPRSAAPGRHVRPDPWDSPGGGRGHC